TNKYGKSFKFLFKHKWITFLILAVCLGLTYFANKTMPAGFVPNEDRGFIMGNIELPAGASVDRVNEFGKKFSEQAQKIPGIESVTIISGRSIISGAGSNYGFMMIKMEGFKERDSEEKSAETVIGKLFGLAGK